MSGERRRIVGVIGAGRADPATATLARRVGRLLGEEGCSIVTGGLGGVMAAASEGFREGARSRPSGAAGLAIGVIPGAEPDEANAFVDVVIATGVGEARNSIIVNTAAALIAVGGEHGTLSEIAFALKQGKRVVSLGSWEIDPAIDPATSPEDAVERALRQPC